LIINLMGKGELNIPEAKYLSLVNEWRRFDTWPPENVTERTYILCQDKWLLFSATVKKQVNDEFYPTPISLPIR